ncbi:hypothetical protein FBU59_001360 [Linderina macrospora]|uniref:Uncharacterized protein n=1 Tax=Linderina macrospora TaxID=4868 RepID=A0ACC1JE33_9FUNG|nr:hypothetical protein FBU59_001360 [Linderina macrospora]
MPVQKFTESNAFIPDSWLSPERFKMTAEGLTSIIEQIIKHKPSPEVTVVRDTGSIFKRGWFGPKKLRKGTRMELNVDSVKVRCPRCHVTGFTEIRRENGKRVFFARVLVAIVLIIINGPLTAASAVNTARQLELFKRKSHFCTSCNVKLGKNVTIFAPKRGFFQRLGFD